MTNYAISPVMGSLGLGLSLDLKEKIAGLGFEIFVLGLDLDTCSSIPNTWK